MAGLSYFFGLVGALIVWAIQKDKSAFVKFHALQALAFEGLVMIFNVLLIFCLFGAMAIGIAASAWIALTQTNSSQQLLPSIVLPIAGSYSLIFCLMPFALVLTVVRLIAALSVVSGRNFRYPWIASRVEAFMAG